MTAGTSTRGAAIEIRSIRKRYGSFVALDEVNMRIEAGEFMTFLGPSGSGKTTTLNLIAGFTDLSGGDIRVGDRSVGGLPAHKRNIGVVFQHYALFPHMTVFKNVTYPLKLRGVPKTERERRARHALEMVRLEDFAHRYPSELSGGQQQRVALARAVVFDPPLLLMDEPLGALDKKLREWLQLEIKRIHRELGSTFVYVTHDQEEALVLSDRIAVFNRGRIEQIGTGHELYTDPATLFVGRFIGESSVLKGPHQSSDGETAIEVAGVKVASRGRPTVPGPHAILVRPEKITVTKPGGEAPGQVNRLRGRVSECLYLGAGTKYEIRLPDGTVILSRMPVAERPFAIGDEVDVFWSIDDSKLLADDGSTDSA